MISNLSYQLVYTLIWLVLPWLFMTIYGSVMNGLILSIRQFLNFFNIVEAGIGLSSVTALLKPLASNDKATVNRILSSTKIFYIRAGYIFLSLITLLAFIYPFFIAHQVSFKVSFFLVLILGSSNFLDFFIIGKYRVLLTADQRFYVFTNIQIISLLINLISYVVLIKFGYNILLVNGIATLMFASRAFIIYAYVKKNYTYVSFKEKPDTSAFAQRKDVFIQQIAGVIVLNTPIILITIFLGLKEVSVFTTYNMVFSAIVLLVTSFSSAFLAGLGDLLVRGEKQRVIEVFTIYESIFYAFITWVFTTTFLLIIPFIGIYTKDVTDVNYVRPNLAILFIVVGVIMNIRAPAYTLINSAGHFKETRNGAIAESIINLVTSFIFISKFGTVGVLIGAFCSSIYRTADIIFYASRKILNSSLKPTIYKLGINLVLSIAAVLPVQWLITINPKNAYEWVIYAVTLSIWNLIVILGGNIIVDPKIYRNVFHRSKVVLSRRVVKTEEM